MQMEKLFAIADKHITQIAALRSLVMVLVDRKESPITQHASMDAHLIKFQQKNTWLKKLLKNWKN